MAGSESFYAEASKAAKDPLFTRLFASLAEQRAGIGSDLARHLELNLETPEAGGTLKDTLHEAWMKMRGLLNGGDPCVLLLEAERAEDRIVSDYVRLIKETAGSALNAVLLSQLTVVKSAHDGIRDLRRRVGKNLA
jgi:uncharacterized protein (TIGR02284 family)